MPVAFVLAGGYSGTKISREALAGLHRLTIAAASGSSPVSQETLSAPQDFGSTTSDGQGIGHRHPNTTEGRHS